MTRDEFMELVYETFADEPDNVLANGIIEAADDYAEHEKAQLSCEGTTEGTTSDTISRRETIEHFRRTIEATSPDTDYNDGFVDGVEFCISTASVLPTIQPVATDTNVGDKISKFIDGLEETFAYIREREGGDSVCGLCEYDGAYIGESGDWCNECPGFNRDDCFKLSDKTRKEWTEEIIKALPTIKPEERTEKRTETHACDLISRQQAIEKFVMTAPQMSAIRIYEAVEILESMPTIQPEPSACECCHEDSDGYVTPIEKNGHASIRFGMDGWELSLHAKGWHGSAKIKYCPICGRRLTHE